MIDLTKKELREYVGDKIRLYRHMRRITQIQLAKAVGVSTPYIHNMETYKSNNSLSLVVLVAVCKHLKIKLSDILPPDLL